MPGQSGRRAARVFVKICGVTNRSDAEHAIAAGADALGFNFWTGSRRYINPAIAREWIRDLPSSITRVAVLVDPSLPEVSKIGGSVDVVQLHGSETIALCRQLARRSIRFWKAIPATRRSRNCAEFGAELIVLDTEGKGRRGFGGTGVTFPWVWARDFISSNGTQKVIIAGGLTPDNVARAIEESRPHGVDVSSGVEAAIGRKDVCKMRDFVAAARALTEID